MKLTIDTKFDIGSTVYNVELYYEYYVEKNPYTVVGVSISISDHTMKTTYRIERDGDLRTVSENSIFATYEECAKWCEEHN